MLYKYQHIQLLSFRWTYAPILVLVGLKFRGNIGTIIRTAVQANYFEAVYIIDAESNNNNNNNANDKKKSWEPKDNTKISMKDIYYYSMLNAPLIPIKRFATINEFFSYTAEI